MSQYGIGEKCTIYPFIYTLYGEEAVWDLVMRFGGVWTERRRWC